MTPDLGSVAYIARRYYGANEVMLDWMRWSVFVLQWPQLTWFAIVGRP